MSLLFVADHASAAVPGDIDLGIPTDWLSEHIAIDLGSADLTQALRAHVGGEAVLAPVSRLVIDLNREPDRDDLIPAASDGRVIAGNVGLSAAARQARIDRFHIPYHDRIAALAAARPPSLIVSVHSFTPSLRSRPVARPWPVGILYNRDDRAARLALAELRAQGIDAGDNEPYSGRDLNYTMNRHAEARGIPYLGFEVRQDQLAVAAGVAHWAGVLAATICHVRGEIA